jgi:hypothetical protein
VLGRVPDLSTDRHRAGPAGAGVRDRVPQQVGGDADAPVPRLDEHVLDQAVPAFARFS